MSSDVAFEILYKEYYVRVFGLCRRLLNSSSMAEDATQEAFVRAYRIFHKYDREQPFWQWIASIASNHCVDLLRRRSRAEKLFGDEDFELSQAESADGEAISLLIHAESSSALNEAIHALPDKYRVPVVLAYFHDASYDQIAKDLAINRSHVGVLLLRAKQQLRKLLSAEESET